MSTAAQTALQQIISGLLEDLKQALVCDGKIPNTVLLATRERTQHIPLDPIPWAIQPSLVRLFTHAMGAQLAVHLSEAWVKRYDAGEVATRAPSECEDREEAVVISARDCTGGAVGVQAVFDRDSEGRAVFKAAPEWFPPGDWQDRLLDGLFEGGQPQAPSGIVH